MARGKGALRIRRAGGADLDVLVRHRRAMFESFGVGDGAALDRHDRVYRRWARPRLRSGTLVSFIVETRDGTDVGGGSLWLQPVQPRPGFDGGGQPYLLSFYTDPAHRGRGVATRVVKACVRYAREHGYPRVTLHASQKGRPVYERLGFERTWEMKLALRPSGGETGRGRAYPGRRRRAKATRRTG